MWESQNLQLKTGPLTKITWPLTDSFQFLEDGPKT